MTRVKICGITNLEDARAAVEYGAHALGFIFVPGTPRYLPLFPESALVPCAVPPFVQRVAVYHRLEDADNNPTDCFFDAVQYYSASADRSVTWERPHIRAFRIRDEGSIEEIGAHVGGASALLLDAERPVRRGPHLPALPTALLLDAYHPARLGGAGKAFNWELAAVAKERYGKPIILAGGLTPENVGDAIAAVRPYAVDVSSGVESEPGRKDHKKLRAFIEAVNRADALIG